VLDASHPRKTADGFPPATVGRLQRGRPRFVPCTPAGIVELLKAYEVPLAGRRAVVLGRSDIVGKPMAALLLARDATVTVCHSKTTNLADLTRQADIIVSAIGRPGFITPGMVKHGATAIDVGTTPVSDRQKIVEL